MIQKNFLIKNPLLAAPIMGDIKRMLFSIPHKAALLQICAAGCTEAQIRGLLALFSTSAISDPTLKICGITTNAIADLPPDGTGVRINLVLTEEADIDVVKIPCVPGEEVEAATKLREHMLLHKVKAVQLFVSNMALATTVFMKESAKGFEDVAFFGTLTTKPIVSLEDQFEAHFTNVFRKYWYGVMLGQEMSEDGYIAVIYSGENLHVKMNYALGWQAIGRHMPIELGEVGELGESTVTRIDGMRAVDIFKEYLGVEPNLYLVPNICEFPLIINRDETDICLIPFAFDEKSGELYFNIRLHPEETVRFSFASSAAVLGASRESCLDMEEFVPEALYLTLCGNRVNFLQENSDIEWNNYRLTNPNFSMIHGMCELSYQYGKGGVLNSAHVAVGMREGERPEATYNYQGKSFKCNKQPHVMPLAERMSVFLSTITKQLEEKASEAQSANKAKSAFLSNMSHEIRTPINAIMGMDEMILRESEDDDVIKYAEDIRSAGNNLLGIVNDVLDFSKIEAGKMDVIPVEYEAASVINDLYNVIYKRASDKGLRLILDISPDIPAVLYGDEIRIKQVITNILTNAVKYTEKGSVTLTIKKIEDDGETDTGEIGTMPVIDGEICYRNPVLLRVEVKDTGIGIKDEDKGKLFSAFERIEEERNRTIEGTGLGLNITARLLSLMGSRLEVESTYGEGSVFAFTIEQGIIKDEPLGDMNSRWDRGSKPVSRYKERFIAPDARVLVVDDTKMNLDVFVNLLKKTRIMIDTAESGQEALDCVKAKAYDVIFLDHRMPHMDGIECFRLMKSMPDNKSIEAPVIALTANAVSGAREEYIREGFTDYLTKPIDSSKLEEMLVGYLPKEKILKGRADKKSVSVGKTNIRPRIALIDDEVTIHDVAKGILGGDYDIKCFDNGADGCDAIAAGGYDLVLLDVRMPGEDGFAVIKRLRSDKVSSVVPVIFLTGDESKDTEVEGFKVGAWDFVRKPFVSEVLKQRVRHTIELSRLEKSLEKEVSIQTLRAEHLTEEIMLALSKAVDAKDHYTNGHSERVAGYATVLAARLGMSEKEQANMHALGLLHDIGKIGVSGDIINKPARLTDEEFAEIKKHTTMGYDILSTISEMPDLAVGARWHHERYDGSGYPDGKMGEDIPYAARIICVADSYDAMTSNRSYSNIRPQDTVRDEILRCKGSQFDPVIADAMIALMDADDEYLMNEQGYEKSFVTKYVSELLERVSQTGKISDESSNNEPVYDDDFSEEESDEDISLPKWIEESDALDSESGIINCGSKEGYLNMLDTFFASIDEKSDEIEDYYKAKDWENYTIKVHALKSSARIIGATELSEAARLLEAAGDNSDLTYIQENTDDLLKRYRAYKDILLPLKADTGELPLISDDMLKDAYASLSEFVEGMDFELSKMIMDSVSEYALNPEDRERFDKLGSCLRNLNWDGMKEILGEVI